jgi:hypothetical protein
MRINQKALEKIIHEVLAKLQEKPKLLLVNEGARNQVKLEYLLSKLQDHWHVEVFHTAEMSLEDQSDFQYLAFLDVSQDLLARGAMGLTDTPGSKMLAKALHKGCPVLFEPSVELQWLAKQEIVDLPERVKSYRAHFIRYKNQLMEFGVWFDEIESLRPSQLRYDKKVLTEKDMQGINTTEVLVFSKTIITSLAKDIARNRGIKIRVDFEGQS